MINLHTENDENNDILLCRKFKTSAGVNACEVLVGILPCVICATCIKSNFISPPVKKYYRSMQQLKVVGVRFLSLTIERIVGRSNYYIYVVTTMRMNIYSKWK